MKFYKIMLGQEEVWQTYDKEEAKEHCENLIAAYRNSGFRIEEELEDEK